LFSIADRVLRSVIFPLKDIVSAEKPVLFIGGRFMIRTNTQKLTVAGMLMAAGLLLPFAFAHGLGVQGTVLLPMHIPVLLAGFVCGPLYGAFCGLLTPALNTLLTGMPAAFPMLPIMTAELTTYGLVSGLLFWKTPLGRKKFGVLPTLATAMLCGRISYWAMFEALAAAFGELKALPVLAAVTTGLPGIVIQFLLIPAVVEALRRFRPGEDTLRSAVNLIREGTAPAWSSGRTASSARARAWGSGR
jgi:niacin transporter